MIMNDAKRKVIVTFTNPDTGSIYKEYSYWCDREYTPGMQLIVKVADNAAIVKVVRMGTSYDISPRSDNHVIIGRIKLTQKRISYELEMTKHEGRVKAMAHLEGLEHFPKIIAFAAICIDRGNIGCYKSMAAPLSLTAQEMEAVIYNVGRILGQVVSEATLNSIYTYK